jgi:hypothetical protein
MFEEDFQSWKFGGWGWQRGRSEIQPRFLRQYMQNHTDLFGSLFTDSVYNI